MRITILAIGSRGDIQPYIALSKGLREAGHSVRLATHAAFATLVRSHAIEFPPLTMSRTSFPDGARQSFIEWKYKRVCVPLSISAYD